MFSCFFDFVVAAHSSAGDVVQFCLYQLFAYRRDAVNVEDSVEVIRFMLNHARMEAIGALVNGGLLFLVAGYILWESAQRFLQPPEIASTGMLVVGAP